MIRTVPQNERSIRCRNVSRGQLNELWGHLPRTFTLTFTSTLRSTGDTTTRSKTPFSNLNDHVSDNDIPGKTVLLISFRHISHSSFVISSDYFRIHYAIDRGHILIISMCCILMICLFVCSFIHPEVNSLWQQRTIDLIPGIKRIIMRWTN